MTHKRFDYPNDALKDIQGYNGVQLPEGITPREMREELFSRLGERFPVRNEPWSKAEPVIDTNDLPSGISEADVETALANMKTDGFL